MTKNSIDVIKRYYYQCINIVNDVCYTEWKHDECKTLRKILFELTGEEKYSSYDKIWESSLKVNEILDNLVHDAENKEILDKLGSDYDKNGIPYWEKWNKNEKNN